jgi:hypothetical protein
MVERWVSATSNIPSLFLFKFFSSWKRAMSTPAHPETDWAFETLVRDRTEHDFVAATGRSASSTIAGQFLKGPVPMWWLSRAAALPGRSLAVGLCIWRLIGVMKDRVRLATKEVEALGVDRHAKSRAIRSLERAGLITVERKRGRFPIVTVVRGATGNIAVGREVSTAG